MRNDGNDDPHSTNGVASRIRDDDELIDLGESRRIMGCISVSTAYTDAELMALKIPMTPGDRRNHATRFIKREVHALRAARVARAEANAPNVRAQVEARLQQRRDRRQLTNKRGRSRNAAAASAK